MSDWNQRLIEGKEALARKKAAAGHGTGSSSRSEDRMPPGQHSVDTSVDFPVLDLGIQPDVPLKDWSLEFTGACENPHTIAISKLEDIGIVDITTDWHCVTTWSTFDMPWRGVVLRDVLELAKPSPEAKHVMFHSYDGYTTNVPLEDCLGDDCMLVTHWRDKPLTREHGGPVRGMIPHLYAWKSAKWVKGIEFMSEDRRGFWEVRGYHNYGDPFLEQRYSRQE